VAQTVPTLHRRSGTASALPQEAPNATTTHCLDRIVPEVAGCRMECSSERRPRRHDYAQGVIGAVLQRPTAMHSVLA